MANIPRFDRIHRYSGNTSISVCASRARPLSWNQVLKVRDFGDRPEGESDMIGMMSTISQRFFISTTFLVVLCMASMAAGWDAAPVIAQEEQLDLAALLLHSDDLYWLTEDKEIWGTADNTPYGLQFSSGFTTLEDALDEDQYALGRGGFTLGDMGRENAANILGDAGWVRAYDQFFVLPDSFDDSQWTYGVAASIEEFETADGAAQAFAAFDNETVLLDVTLSESARTEALPESLNDHSATMWGLVTTRFGDPSETLTLWVQVDTLIVSVALLNANGNGTPDPELLEQLMNLQLKRIEHAEHLYQPHLSTCAPRLGGDGVFDLRNDYSVLNGTAFAHFGDTYVDLEESQRTADEMGTVDHFVVNQRLAGTSVGAYAGEMYFRVDLRAFVDEDHAEEYLGSRGDALEADVNFSAVEAILDIPEIGDDARAFTYLGGDGYLATIVFVRVEEQAFAIRLGSTTDVVPDSVIELAEAQIARVADGDCGGPMEVPDGL